METNIIHFVLLLGAASTLGVVFLAINAILGPNGLLGPKTPVSPIKFENFDCGNVLADVDARINFDVRFYLIGILFLIFDMETVFLSLIVTNFKVDPVLSVTALLLFTFTLVVGFVYILLKGAMEKK